MIAMLIPLFQVLFVALRVVFRSAVNVMLYSILWRIFSVWFGLNSTISFFCSLFCLTKVVAYFQRLWLTGRLKNKKPDERIVLNELTWESPTTLITKLDNPNEATDKFELDWNFLLDNDAKTMFPLIVNIPFSNGWLVFGSMIAIDYQMKNYDFSYTMSLIRTVGVLIILVCGSAIRYQTLFDRDKNNFFNLMIKKRDEIERYILYSTNNYAPIASVCLQLLNTPESSVFMVQLYQINSKFEDYMFDIASCMCDRLIERIQNYGNEHQKSIYLIWSIPTCKQNWKYAVKAKKFLLRNSYKDFSFMPFIHSSVEQYQYLYEYKDLPPEIVDE